jgi:hypothetical protein
MSVRVGPCDTIPKQEVLERTNSTTLITLLNNVVIDLKNYIQRLLWRDIQTRERKVKFVFY